MIQTMKTEARTTELLSDIRSLLRQITFALGLILGVLIFGGCGS